MAAATSTANKLRTELFVRTVIHQPAAAATAQLVDFGQPQGASVVMIPIENFHHFLVQVTASLLVGAGVTVFEIHAGTSAAGAGNTVVKAHAVGSAPDAEGDSLNLEVSVEQIHESLPTATHVGVWIDAANNDDEAAVTIIGVPRFAYDNLTPDYVAA